MHPVMITHIAQHEMAERVAEAERTRLVRAYARPLPSQLERLAAVADRSLARWRGSSRLRAAPKPAADAYVETPCS